MSRILTLVAFLCVAASDAIAAERKPNIIFIFADDQRASSLWPATSTSAASRWSNRLLTWEIPALRLYLEPPAESQFPSILKNRIGMAQGEHHDRPGSFDKQVGTQLAEVFYATLRQTLEGFQQHG